MNKIPCIQNSCLLLPICQNKEIIKCDELYSFCDRGKYQKSISKYLPELTSLESSTCKYIYVFFKVNLFKEKDNDKHSILLEKISTIIYK